MSTPAVVHRDERTTAVENASYRWAYLFLSFGLLALVGYRSFVNHEHPWDLLALVILGGGVSAAHQRYHDVLSRRWLVVSLLSALLALAFAALLVLARA